MAIVYADESQSQKFSADPMTNGKRGITSHQMQLAWVSQHRKPWKTERAASRDLHHHRTLTRCNTTPFHVFISGHRLLQILRDAWFAQIRQWWIRLSPQLSSSQLNFPSRTQPSVHETIDFTVGEPAAAFSSKAALFSCHDVVAVCAFARSTPLWLLS